MKKNLLVLFAFFLFGVVYSQIPTFLNSQSYSAVGAGSAGIPSVSYNIPAGKNRFMVINVLVERHHYPLSSNHPVVPEANGSYLLRANINGVLYDLPGATTARGPNMSTNEVNERSFTFTQFTGLINLETNAVPAGATTVTFPNFNVPGAASDEVSVIISVYENVKTFRTAGTFFPRTTVPSETNLGTITGTFNTSFIPGGRTLADVMFVTNGGITQASALTLAPGSNWTSTSSMKNIVPNTVDWPAGNGVFTTNNTPLGISSVSAYTNITSGVPSYDFMRANTGNIEAGVATMYSLIPFGTPEVSGTVFLDNNGPTTIEGTATNAGGLFVNVINSVGNLVYSAAVNSSGVFTIPTGYLTEGNVYDYQLSKNTGTVGQPAPFKELPASWVTVGESRNTTGNDGLADGNIRFMLGSNNVSDLRYGINQVSWGTPISCNDAKTYVVMQNVTGISGITSLYTVDMITGVTNVVKNPILPATEGSFRRINCIGYNSLDGFIYGYRSQTNQIVKIDALGNYELLTVPNLVTADVSTATAGDIRNNELYIFDNDQRRIWKINLATLAVTIIPFTLPNSNDIFTISINDFAFGLDGNIYGMLTDKRLFKLDLTTNALSYLGSATGTGMTTETGSWGTAFIDAAGNLYVGNNGSRNTYKFEYNLATNTYSLNAQLFSNLEATGQVLADGASCAFVIPPNSKDDSFCMQSNTSVQSFPIDVLINDVKGTFDIDPSTVRLINPLTSLPTTTVTIAG
ncbi:hypothetical protein PQ459_01940 [Chryseobacterium sp. KACC 21268]|nr:hypothetical protein PQ459_01940 [Chryseobacterium sp. KACC 21268]